MTDIPFNTFKLNVILHSNYHNNDCILLNPKACKHEGQIKTLNNV